MERIAAVFGPTRRAAALQDEDWGAVVRLIGSDVPPDYRWFLDSYGASVIGDHLYIDAPQAAGGLKQSIVDKRAMLRSWAEGGGSVYPELSVPEEVLPWGYSEWEGDLFFFHMVGPPEQWPILLLTRQPPRLLKFELCFVDFLLDYVSPRVGSGGSASDALWAPWDD